MAILDGDVVYEVDFGDESVEVFWTPDANEMALTVCLYNDATGDVLEHDLPVQDAREMAFAILDATGGRD